MNYVTLRKNIIALANLPKGDAPIISAYFNMKTPLLTLIESFDSWNQMTRKTLQGESRQTFDAAATQIADWLRFYDGHSHQGIALFARAGEQPLFLPLTFKVPFETHFIADSLPSIYPLVELKDKFHRFVVVVTTQEMARIFEMNLGETSTELLAERPALRERHGREWTREHYQNHCHDRDRKFIKEKVTIIENLMSKRGHNALILAGEPRLVNRLQDALPTHLKKKVVDQIRTGIQDERVHDVLENAILSYVKVEGSETKDTVKHLFNTLRSNNMATIGVSQTRAALQRGQVDTLVIANDLPHFDREELVRLASQYGVSIETVQGASALDQNGSVGAFLRYPLQPTHDEVTELSVA